MSARLQRLFHPGQRLVPILEEAPLHVASVGPLEENRHGRAQHTRGHHIDLAGLDQAGDEVQL